MFLLFLLDLVSSEIYFREEFDLYWKKRWVYSHYYEREGKQGDFLYESPPVYANKEGSRGLLTHGVDKQFQLSCDIGRTINPDGKLLIISFTVNFLEDTYSHAQAFLKLFPEGFNQSSWSANDTCYLCFGPELTHDAGQTHFVFRRGNQIYPTKQVITCKNDKNTHLYTLVLFPDWTYEIQIDDYVESRGRCEDMWDYFLPRDYEVGNAKKPDDWDEREFIVDETDTKPQDWDQPPTIPDPTSKKPKDWDEADGEWIPAEISNPRYKGLWKPKMIPNPKYKGKWETPRKMNPAWEEAKEDFAFKKLRYVAIDSWQGTTGTIFDNIFIGDCIEEYQAFVKTTWYPQYREEIKGTGYDEVEELLDYEVEGFWDESDDEEIDREEEEEEALRLAEEEEEGKEDDDDEDDDDDE